MRSEKCEVRNVGAGLPALHSDDASAGKPAPTATVEALLAAGATLARLVQDLADDTRESANDDPETTIAASLLQAAVDAWQAAGGSAAVHSDPVAWDRGCAPGFAQPEPLRDVLAYRDERDRYGEPMGWDLCFLDADGRWHSSTYGGEIIQPPVRWWSLPEEVRSAECGVREAVGAGAVGAGSPALDADDIDIQSIDPEALWP